MIFSEMKSIIKTLTAAAAALLLGAMSVNAQALSESTRWHWNKGTIEIETPERPAGQQHAIKMAAEKLQTVRVAFVGLGMRGPGAVERFMHIPGIEVVALCDYEQCRAEKCQKFLRDAGFAPARIYSGAAGYEELCAADDIDLVYVATDWDHHFPVAKCALEHGKHAAIEVPSAMNMEQCWELINLVEKNRRHCMILENCCYDWFEMDALNMAQKGLFGELVYARGAYIHTLDETFDWYWINPEDKERLGWRLKYNKENRGDVYATHGLGPVAQAMNIHRGDRFTKLVAMDSKSVVGKELVKKKTGKECGEFRNGDHTVTLMKTARGKLVEIQHNVMSPQPYNRLHQLVGSRGMCNKYPQEGIALSGAHLKASGCPDHEDLSAHSYMSAEDMKALRKKYNHPILKIYGRKAAEVGGHGGMDFIMDSRLIYCLQNGLPLDMDVYDLAEWCSIAELGSLSMDNDNASVAFPDFTRGYWNMLNGFRHEFAEPEQEAATAARATAYTAAHKELAAKYDLWTLYDAMKKAEGRVQVTAAKKYNRALAKFHAELDARMQENQSE